MSKLEASNQSAGPDNPQSSPSFSPIATRDTAASEQRHSIGAATGNVHRDLNQIIAHAREDIRRLREEQTRQETQIASAVQERDEIQLQYTHLHDNFIEAVHIAAEKQILQAAHDLRITPGAIPKLFEPIQESITHWLATQQAEREAALHKKLETVEQKAAIIRQELIRDQEALAAERQKFAQERETFAAHMKSREEWLQNRWLAKAWSTAALMFLILPAFELYLFLQKTNVLNIIIIPTVTCLILAGVIKFVQSRKRPPPKQSAEKK